VSALTTKVYRITREDLIRAGALIDITDVASRIGLTWPVAITAGVAESGARPETVAYAVLDRLVSVGIRGGEPCDLHEATGPERMYFVLSPEGRDGAMVITVLLEGED
jgi:hypothetical protein